MNDALNEDHLGRWVCVQLSEGSIHNGIIVELINDSEFWFYIIGSPKQIRVFAKEILEIGGHAIWNN